jgi:ribose/xylose/arabinose/galactoside ABC-type transport system permease subunit
MERCPVYREPMHHPRPSLAVHLGWELILLLAVLAVTGFAARQVELFEDGRLLWSIAYLGLLASALALSLRMGTPNLSTAAAATLSMVVYGNLTLAHDAPSVVAAAVAVLAAGMLGAALALAADLLEAPVWAVTFAGPVVAGIFVTALLADPIEVAGPAAASAAVPWLLALAVVSVGGGAWFAMPAVRRRLAGDAGPPQSWVRLLIGLTGSSLVAGVSGVIAVLFTRESFPDPMFGTFPMFTGNDLFVVLAAVLLGGVSIRGEQGGVAGTLLSVILLAVVLAWLGLADAGAAAVWLVLALALLAGFAVRRGMLAVAVALGAFESPVEPDLDEDVQPPEIPRADQRNVNSPAS